MPGPHLPSARIVRDCALNEGLDPGTLKCVPRLRAKDEVSPLAVETAPDANISEAERLHCLDPIYVAHVDNDRLGQRGLDAVEVEGPELVPLRDDDRSVSAC